MLAMQVFYLLRHALSPAARNIFLNKEGKISTLSIPN
jgi:hypothetical protein